MIGAKFRRVIRWWLPLENKRAERGTIYVLHLDPPFKHARHYTGWTQDLAGRLERHRRGNGSKLLAAAVATGCTFRLARTWSGCRNAERRIKRTGGASRFCPICMAERAAAEASGSPEPGPNQPVQADLAAGGPGAPGAGSRA
jgi:predicted GIY-YIG superfamily endonuclease